MTTPTRAVSSLTALGATLLLSVQASPSQSQVISRQPSLHQSTASSVVVTWRTTSSTEGRVRYGTSPDTLNLTADSATAGTHHEVRVEGLQPDTRYYYSVGTPEQVLAGGEAGYYFKTSPPPGSQAPFRVWVVGDSGTGGSAQRSVRDAMTAYVGATPPDLFVHVGDMAYSDGTNDEFQSRFYDIYASILTHTVIWPALGNHEGRSSDSGGQTGPYFESYALPARGEAGGLPSGTEAYYSFDYANAHFVVLDSHDSPREPNGAMLQWLEQDLASTSQEWLIAYWHHPPYSKGSHDSDTERPLIEMRENALPILEAAGVDLVLAGHSHVYERSFLLDGAYDTPTRATGSIVDGGDGRIGSGGPYIKSPGLNPNEGAVYVVAGHGGAGVGASGEHPMMVVTEVANGSCLVDIEGSTLTLRNLRWDGVISDAFTIAKGDALILETPRGGEQLLSGSSHTIRWSTVGDIPQVKLEYSVDEGEQWQLISASEANTGSYAWRVPQVTTERALVRVSSATNAELIGSSGGVFTIGRLLTQETITWGDTWRYNDQGQDLGDSWLTVDSDDSNWPSGAAQLGYGDGDEATVLRDTDPNIPSYYFRKRFELPGELTEAVFNVIHDDGVAIWVNGALVFSKYVDDGLGFGSYASSGSSDNEPASTTVALSPTNPFVAGENVVAVMVKQRSASSSDVSFDLQLSTTVLVNGPPVLMPISEQRVAVGETLTLQLEASDPDGDGLTFRAEPLPTGSTLDEAGGLFRWSPLEGQVGIYPVTFVVSDGQQEVSQVVTIVVEEAPAVLPELQTLMDREVREGERLTFRVEANDDVYGPLMLRAFDLPEGAVFDAVLGDFDWTPGFDQAGVYTVTFVATDDRFSDIEEVRLTVINVNRAPTLSSIPSQTVVAGEVLLLGLEGMDPDGDPLVYSLEGPEGATLDGEMLRWQTSATETGRYPLTVTVSDGALTASQTFEVEVTASAGTASGDGAPRAQEEGCGCRHIDRPGRWRGWPLLLIGLVWVGSARRRRSRRS